MNALDRLPSRPLGYNIQDSHASMQAALMLCSATVIVTASVTIKRASMILENAQRTALNALLRCLFQGDSGCLCLGHPIAKIARQVLPAVTDYVFLARVGRDRPMTKQRASRARWDPSVMTVQNVKCVRPEEEFICRGTTVAVTCVLLDMLG